MNDYKDEYHQYLVQDAQVIGTADSVKFMYCRATNFQVYKISRISGIFRTSKIFILEIVRSSSSTAYYLLILENIFAKNSV